MPLGPCLQSLCPLCNARSYPHPRTITGLSLAALWGQDAGRGVAVHSPSHGFRLVGVGALAARPRSQDPRLGSNCGQGADAPWGSCHLCSSLWCACSGRGCRSRSQTWRASGEALEFLQCSWRLFFLPLFSIHSCPRKWLLHCPRLRTSPTFLLPLLRPLVICR